jgi:phage shock protein PspC (stress-responsive transcriptional regulator)/anti-sigma regulatory factor (Ser/Thr protein kinase)
VADREGTRASPKGLRRDPANGIVGGVVAGFAARLGVDPTLLRVVFAAGVVVTGGALLLAYGFAWALMPTVEGSPPLALPRGVRVGRGWHLGAGVGLLMLSALLVFREVGIWWSDQLVWPLVLVSAGLALLWGQSRTVPPIAGPLPAQVPLQPGPHASPPTSPSRSPRSSFAALYRGGFGIALVVGAALLFLSTNNALGAARDAAITSVVAIVALALILAPFIWRLGRNLATERAERIRSQERAEVAAHLHDSVLQTLTLMQKRADDPREVAALARRQERELRAWLSGGGRADAAAGFAGTLTKAAEEVEDSMRVKVDVVTVGDHELDDGAAAVVAAAREALVNAAKFAPGSPITVYAEAAPERIEVYVRDRGPGFDPAAVPADRRGVRDSIIGRMRRHGGAATITHVADAGTEVALTLERSNP